MEPLTIGRPIPFGYNRDGTYAAAEMRQKCVAIVGTPGSGKTVVEQCFLAGLVRCPDALVWPIDLSNGGLTNPWLGPWLDGDMASPVLDWCAFTIDEALTMTEMALQVIDYRRTVYRRLMRRHDDDKLPCSHEIPAIYILLDEGKEATGISGNQQLIRNLIRIADKGRAVAVRIIITGLRATSETIPKEMMADIGARLAMNVAEDNELAHILGWKVKYNARDFPYQGCGLWRDSLGGAPQRFRSFDLSKPSSIERIAMACEPWRPALDEPSASVGLGSEYLARWERAVPLLRAGEPDEPWPVNQPPAGQLNWPVRPPVNQPLNQPVNRSGGPVQNSPVQGVNQAVNHGLNQPVNRSIQAGSDEVAAKIAHARRVIGRRDATAPDRVDAEWARLAAELGDDRAAGGEGWADDVATDPRARIRQLLAVAGEDGMSGPKIRETLATEGHDVPTTTLYRWLNADAVDGGYGAWHPRTEQKP